MKKKVFISGTCHGKAIGHLLEQSPEFSAQYDIQQSYIGWVPQSGISDVVIKNIQESDICIYQSYLSASEAEFLSYLPSHSRAIKLPLTTLKIYWPSHFSTPRDFAPRSVPGNIRFCCKTLDKLIEEHGIADKVIQIYTNLDLSQEMNLKVQFYEQIQHMKHVQKNTDFELDKLFIENFKHIQMFQDPIHPNVPVFEYLANKILVSLGFNEPIVYDGRLDWDFGQTIIHPSIIDYYGLTWCNKDTIWNITAKHKGTFQDYLRIYVESKLAQKKN